MNVVWTLLSHFLIYKITALLNAREMIQKYTILLTFPLSTTALFSFSLSTCTIPGLFFCRSVSMLLSSFGSERKPPQCVLLGAAVA